jgi:hypothetical protein
MRQEAGESYARAVALYVSAWVQLRSIELSIINLDLDSDVKTFSTPPAVAAHPDFLPSPAALHSIAHQQAVENVEWMLVELAKREAQTSIKH